MTLAQVVWEYITHRKVAKTQIIIAILVVIFGGATLYFHNEEFIKWKVSIINWLMGVGLIVTTYTMKETPMQKILKENIELENINGKSLIICGGLLYSSWYVEPICSILFSTNVWMNFKLLDY